MVRSMITFVFCLAMVTIIASENLNGIFVIDSCDCDSLSEQCEQKGPFIFDQQRSSLAVRYGSLQIGVGTLDNNRLDLYLNKNRCKGVWNGKTRLAEIKCQHQAGTICTIKIRCVSGACLDNVPTKSMSSAAVKTTATSLFATISLFLLFV